MRGYPDRALRPNACFEHKWRRIIAPMVRLAKQPKTGLVLLLLVPALLILSYGTQPNTNVDHQPRVLRADEDVRLQFVATSALGTHEGAIVVIDPASGRVRAVVNAPLAFQSAFP